MWGSFSFHSVLREGLDKELTTFGVRSVHTLTGNASWQTVWKVEEINQQKQESSTHQNVPQNLMPHTQRKDSTFFHGSVRQKACIHAVPPGLMKPLAELDNWRGEGGERKTIREGINEREREYRICFLCAFCEDETLKSH